MSWLDILLFVAAALVLGSLVLRAMARRREPTPFEDEARPYDFFISYRSSDVALARALGELLLASGAKPWFAEYEFHFVGREDDDYINQRIDRGVAACARGVALSSPAYWNSQYCRREAEALLRSKRADDVLHVQLGPEVGDSLRDLPTLVIERLPTSGEESRRVARQILEFINERMPDAGLELSPNAQLVGGSQGVALAAHGLPFRLDLGRWRVDDDGMNAVGLPRLRLPLGEGILRANVAAGPERSREALDARLHQRDRQLTQDDDRALYRNLVATVERHVRGLKADAVGVHLYWYEGHAQIGTTYRAGSLWMRKVSLIAAIQPFEDVIEFVFTFGFHGSFNAFVRVLPEIDRLIESLRMGPRGGQDAYDLLQGAFRAVEAGNDARALLLLSQAVREDPDNADVHNEVGVCLFRVGRHRAAAESAQRAHELDPAQPKFRMSVLAARFALARREPGRSAVAALLEDCVAFLQEHPDYPSGHLLRAEALAFLGEPSAVWESCLLDAEAAYGRWGRMASGTSLDPRRVQAIIEGTRRSCQRQSSRP